MMQNSSCFVNGSSLVFNKSCDRNGAEPPSMSRTYTLTSIALLSVLIPVIVVGNGFVILAFATTRRLRTTTNYFVLSLAVADIMVGSLSLPIFTVVLNNSFQWRKEHPTVNHLWTAVDMITATASIVNLVYISVDRYICIQYPFRYHALLNKTKVTVMIVASWLYGGVNYSLVVFTYKKERPQPKVILPIAIMAFVVPLVVIIVMYAKIGKIALSHRIRIMAMEERNSAEEKKKKGTMSLLKELKATRILAVVIGAFVLCWIGHFALLLYTTICRQWQSLTCVLLPTELTTSIQWIKYFNSSLNPFIYAVMNVDMRKAFRRFMKGKLTTSSDTSFELRDRP